MSASSQNSGSGTRSLTPAVVVGGSLNALGAVRSLAAGRMPIYLLDTTRDCAASWSRYCRFVAVPSLEGQRLVDALIELARRLGCRPVLILTSDQCVDTVSALREQLAPHYSFSLPPDSMVRALADKTLFQTLAEEAGFEVPRACCISNAADLERITTLRPPLIVKPGDKTAVLRGEVERVVRCEEVAAARTACTTMLAKVSSVVVQEWIDGPDSSILFTLFACDREGALLGAFHGRKLVCDPPGVGTTAVCTAAPEYADRMMKPTQDFIQRVGYRGLGSVEFKIDAQRDRLAIIEPTVGRTDWQSEIAPLSGVNLPLRLYWSELGLTTGIAEEPRQSAWRSSAGFHAPLRPGTRLFDGFFRWEDPLPALYYYAYDRGLRRIWRRLLRTIGKPTLLSTTRA